MRRAVSSPLSGNSGPFGGNAVASNGHLHEAALAFLGASDVGDLDEPGGGSVHDLRARRREPSDEPPLG